MRTPFRTALAAVVLTVGLCTAVGAATTPTLFRVFLLDGTAIVSFGEFARVDDMVIVSMPVGGTPEQPRLHMVTLPASVIDWNRTDRYAASARVQQYAATRGEEDFQLLSNEVARVLNEIALSTDRPRALALAEEARRAMADWPQAHYGYRQQDVREIVGLLDEAISGLRGAAGGNAFELSLVAVAPPAVPLEPLLGMPSPRDLLDQIFRVAAMTPRSTDRIVLLQSALALLAEAGPAIDPSQAGALRRSAQEQIRRELDIDARYARLARQLTQRAARAATRARVADVERVLNRIAQEDARLGGQRPELVQALHAAVQGQLDAARRLRLLRDHWLVRRQIYRDYQRTIGTQLLQLVKAQPALEAIRRLEGPAPDRLVALRSRLSGGIPRLERVSTPDDLRVTHDLLIGAWRFAESAAAARYNAVSSGNVSTAWEASSAAAGALMLLARAQQELRTILEPPSLQ